MNRRPVVSSSVVSVGYCGSRRVLEIEFARGGIYEYLEVRPEDHEDLMAAASKGAYVNMTIKARYAFRNVRSGK